MGQDELEIDVSELIKFYMSKVIIILLSIFVWAGVIGGIYKLKNKVVYTADTKLYITIPKTSDKSLIYDDADKLVLDYLELIRSDLIIDKVSSETKLPVSEIKDSVSVTQVTGKRFIIITTQNEEEDKTSKISNSVLKNTNKTITDVLKKDKPIIVEKTKDPVKINTINVKKYIFIGALAGLVLSIIGVGRRIKVPTDCNSTAN